MASKNAKKTLERIAKNGAAVGASKGEQQAAANLLARVQESTPIKIVPEFKMRRHRGEASQLITHEAIKHFLRSVKGGETLSYRDLISREFGSSDFYIMIEMLNSLGLVQKRGSSYTVEKSYKSVFTPWYNSQIQSLMI